MTAWLDFDDFSGLVGEPFSTVVEDGAEVTLTLAEATLGAELGGPGPDGTPRRQFSLVFAGPAQPALGQGTRELSHAGLGAVALFLVPVGGDAEGLRYQAVFA
ncbi:DUF6916 family protein [Nocardioides kongjuensis]|uniref:DUF6916 family protein n=1 Tax=Nocardioides kongjuensis TaxID=349522 RepID=UPI0035EFBDF8